MTACGRREETKERGLASCLLRSEGSIPCGSRVDDVDRCESIERTLDYKDSKRGGDNQPWSTLSSWPAAGAKQRAQGYVSTSDERCSVDVSDTVTRELRTECRLVLSRLPDASGRQLSRRRRPTSWIVDRSRFGREREYRNVGGDSRSETWQGTAVSVG